MANKSEDRQGMIFVGTLIVGVGVGLIISTITENWIYMAACSTIGAGMGFVFMSLIARK